MSRAQLTSTVEQNTGGAVSPYVAGKNKIINGDFSIWQRGTSFTQALNAVTYCVDRWSYFKNGTGTTQTITQQTFTPGAAPVSGYEGTYFSQILCSVAGSGTDTNVLQQRIEDVRVFAGQTVTMSFWAKADSSRNITVDSYQIFGSGGSADVSGTASSAIGLTTSWARYTATLSVASISGKTVGTSSSVAFRFVLPVNTTFTISIWGVQVEAGSVATPFTTATGTLSGELALAQRYYYRLTSVGSSSNYQHFGMGQAYSTSAAKVPIFLPVAMRTSPSISSSGSIGLLNSTNTSIANASVSSDGINTTIAGTVWGSSSGLVAGNATTLMANGNSSCFIEFSSEL